eukprot:7059494-Prymnesium_polylepis.1
MFTNVSTNVSDYVTLSHGCSNNKQRRVRIRIARAVPSLGACAVLCDTTPRCKTVFFKRAHKECWLHTSCATTGIAGPCRMGEDVEDHIPCTATRDRVALPPHLVVLLTTEAVARLAARLRSNATSYNYTSMTDGCSHQRRDLTASSFTVGSLADCQARCNLVVRCRAVAFRALGRQCMLKRGCDATSSPGACPKTMDRGRSCVFARDLATRLQSETTRRRRAQNMTTTNRRIARRRAQVALERARTRRQASNMSVCDRTSLSFLYRRPRAVVNATAGMDWRYYTAFPCGDAVLQPPMCMAFKTGIVSASMGVLRSFDGSSAAFGGQTMLASYPIAQQKIFVHNAAILRLSLEHSYAM